MTEPSIFCSVTSRDDDGESDERWDIHFPTVPRAGERIRFRDPQTRRHRHLNVTAVVWQVIFEKDDTTDVAPEIQCIDLGDDQADG